MIPQGGKLMKKLWMIKLFYDKPRNVVNDEALIDDKCNDGDDYVVFQDAARSIELVPNDIPRKEKIKF